MRTYTVVLDPDLDEGGYTVTVPALPGCVTQGETVEQCRDRSLRLLRCTSTACAVTASPSQTSATTRS